MGSESKRQEAQILQQPASSGQGIRRRVSNGLIMDATSIGVAEEEDREGVSLFRFMCYTVPSRTGGTHDGRCTGAALGRLVIEVNNLLGREWMSSPYPPETWATLGPGGHENTLGGDTGAWCGCGTHPRRPRRGRPLWSAGYGRTRVAREALDHPAVDARAGEPSLSRAVVKPIHTCRMGGEEAQSRDPVHWPANHPPSHAGEGGGAVQTTDHDG